MNINRTALMAGVAALTLTVGTGFTSAQEQPKGHNAAPQAAQPHPAAQPRPTGQPHPSQPMAGRANTGQPQRAAVPRGQAAQQAPRDRKDNGRVGQSGAQPGTSVTSKRAQGVSRSNKSDSEGTTAQERRVPPGLQGNASGQTQGQHQLSEEQRTHIRQTVINARGAPRVGHVDFDVRVGTRIGRGRIHLIGVPDALVQIDPEWEGFLYFVYEDEIVVVDPNDMEIVAVLPV
jgi:Protein of unknown function (DUF1236)